MTKEEAEIVLLKAALVQAQHTIEFMHGCLTRPDHSTYAYPEHTVRHLEQFARLAPLPPMCHHSRRYETCESCRYHHDHAAEIHAAWLVYDPAFAALQHALGEHAAATGKHARNLRNAITFEALEATVRSDLGEDDVRAWTMVRTYLDRQKRRMA